VLEATFAAVSSSGVRASEGSSAAWAGRKAVAATEITVASPKSVSTGASAKATAAQAAMAAARATLAPAITRTRSRRSPRIEVNGAANAAGTMRTRRRTPRPAAPLSEKATTESASMAPQSPNSELVNASWSRRRLSLRKTPANAARDSARCVRMRLTGFNPPTAARAPQPRAQAQRGR